MDSMRQKLSTFLSDGHQFWDIFQHISNSIDMVDIGPLLFPLSALNLPRLGNLNPGILEPDLVWLSISANGHKDRIDLYLPHFLLGL